MKPILEIQNVGKKYLIKHEEQQPYLSLRDSVTGIFKSKSSKEEFWALKDVNFTVNPGESLGIIGKNGAGKSTLLKILSRITPPTTGKIISRGRIASLLEVGTGFHPELSGRENIFMNGSILGMRKAEILKNFDAIVDFSGVEKFLDTPLKHYSSGMQLRLAFAVAAFLENEILIIDEVLAVGDAEFQKKCMGKMGEVASSGRTVLFVSHNMAAVKSLCENGLLLENGEVKLEGKINEVLDLYNSDNIESNTYYDTSNFGDRKRGLKQIYIKSVNIHKNLYSPNDKFQIDIQLNKNEVLFNNKEIHLAVFIFDILQNNVYQLSTMFSSQKISFDERSLYSFSLNQLNLTKGHYTIGVWLQGNNLEQDYLDQSVSFEIGEGTIYELQNPLIVSLLQKEFNFSQS